MQGKVFQSPVTSPDRILDFGCHLGVCTVHLSGLSTEVHEFDMWLDKIPLPIGEPTNVSLGHGNMYSMDLIYEWSRIGSQDFIFTRLVAAAMENWKNYIEKAFQMLKVGGIWNCNRKLIIDIDSRVISQSWYWWQFYSERLLKHMADSECARKAEGWIEVV